MTDTITLPSGVEVYEGKVLVLPGASTIMPVGDLTPADVQSLIDAVNAAMGQELGDLANVSEAGKVEGMVLGVLADGNWSPQVLTGKLERVGTNWNTKEVQNVSWLTVGNGIDIHDGTSTGGRAHLQLVWGASGSSNAIARADHTHPPTLKSRYMFNKSAAVLGGGTSELVNETVTGLVSTVIYDVDITGRLEAVNTNMSGRLYLRTQIGANTEQSVTRGFSGGVWTEASTTGTQMSVTGVTSLQLKFWAEYQTGDPTALYTGELAYSITPRGGTS